MIFQAMSAGFGYVASWRRLIATGSGRHQDALISHVKEHFGAADVRLYSKGRSALAEAISLSRPGRTAICAFTCYSVVQAAEYAKRELVFVDVAPNSVNFDTKSLKSALEKYPDITSIVIQNTLGNTIDIEAVNQLAKQYNIMLIEDLAHCVGGRYPSGEEVGTVGDLVMLSFGREKIVDVGNGGVLVVRDPALQLPARTMRTARFSQQLRDRIYPLVAWHARKLWHLGLGKIIMAGVYKAKLAVRSADGPVEPDRILPGWQSKLALRDLKCVAAEIKHRGELAKIYETELTGSGPSITTGKFGFLRFSLFIDDRRALLHRLAKRNFQLYDTWYDTPIGPKRYFNLVDYPNETCPNAVKAAATILNLPTHRGISIEDAHEIAGAIKEEII